MRFRRFAKILLTVGLVAMLGNGTTAFADTVKVNASNLNFRTSAGMSAEVIRMLPRGTVLERTENLGEWSKVTVDGVHGFVASRYLQVLDAVVSEHVGITVSIPDREAISGQQIMREEDHALTDWDTVYASAAWTAGLKSEYQYAANSKINTGQAVFYQTNAAIRKEKDVCMVC